MTAPNIDMIAASLRSCSLGSSGGRGNGGEGGAASPPPPARYYFPEESAEGTGRVVTVDLNSDAAALPQHWEQCLDIRSGEIYYINWETGVRTTEDPRNAVAAVYSSGYYYYYSDDDDDDDASSDEYSCASHIGSSDDDSGDDGDGDTADSSSSSVSSESPPHAVAGGGGHVLVAAGCKSCFMYFMVPKRVDACPKCGGGLLHLGRNGCV